MDAAVEQEFWTEFMRVARDDLDATVFSAWQGGPPAVENLQQLTAWLRALPSGLGMTELERLAAERWGGPPE
jgi:hypothetical protein